MAKLILEKVTLLWSGNINVNTDYLIAMSGLGY